jgi:transcription initiation factor TFIIB
VTDEWTGEVICSKCGLVILDEVLNRSPEWRAFTLEEKRSRQRVGAPIDYSRFDKGLSTIIQINRNAFGHLLPAETRRRMWRLRRAHIRSRMQASDSRNLMQAMRELERISVKLHIPSFIQEMAAVIYRKSLNADLIRGRSIAAIVAAALYVACRFTKTSRTLKEIAEASIRDKKEISRCYFLIVRKLGMKMPFADPLDHISRIAEKLGVSGEAQSLAVKILREAKRKRITTGKDPLGIAATLLYIACQLKGEKMTQMDIAAAAGVTEVTIRNRKKELMEKLDLGEFP